jgi:hypothetical protein
VAAAARDAAPARRAADADRGADAGAKDGPIRAGTPLHAGWIATLILAGSAPNLRTAIVVGAWILRQYPAGAKQGRVC